MSTILFILLCGFILFCVFALFSDNSHDSFSVKCKNNLDDKQSDDLSRISLDLDISKF